VLGLQCRVEECVPGKPTVLLTRPGARPDLPSVLLNSHTDVVPASAEHWTREPFGGERVGGRIYGRGTQDMKSVGVQYLAAMASLRGAALQRTVHLGFNPDEEIGGQDGLAKFVHTPLFKSLNVGFGMDEGLASPTEVIPPSPRPGPAGGGRVLRRAKRVLVPGYCTGAAWPWLQVYTLLHLALLHPARFVEGTAAEKARRLINRLLDWREEQRLLLASDPSLSLGDVASCNLTMLSGGSQANVLPDTILLTWDVRLPPTTDLAAWEARLAGWMEDAGPGLSLTWLQRMQDQSLTPVTHSDPWYGALGRAFHQHGLQV
jgi:aminoacylase